MSEDLNKLRELAESLQAGSAGFVRSRDFLNARHDFIDAAKPAVILDLFSRLQAAEERAERADAALRVISDGTVSSAPEGHYLAHRAAVKVARAALKTEGA